jgi:uncharacterized protein (DUF433 family)
MGGETRGGEAGIMSEEELMAKAKQYGKHIVADPRICHGKLTFRGTRIFVSDVLKQVADGMDWDRIVWEWRGDVSREAIGEAVELARGAMLKQHGARPARRRAAQ